MNERMNVLPRLSAEMRMAIKDSRRAMARMTRDPALSPLAADRAAYDFERAYWNTPLVPMARIVDEILAVSPLPIATRRYYPAAAHDKLPTIVFIHGGAFILGSLDTHDRVMRLLAQKTGAVVIGLDYALAPEHKFPVAHDQIVAAIRHLTKKPPNGVDMSRLAIAGDSAGATLGLAAALDVNRILSGRLKALAFYYGAFGLTDSVSRRLYGNEIDGMTRENMESWTRAYLNTPAERQDPRFDTLAADLGGLPPVFLGYAEMDPVADDSVALAAKLRLAGGTCELRSYPGVLHGFIHMSRMVPTAMKALDHGAMLLRRALAPTNP